MLSRWWLASLLVVAAAIAGTTLAQTAYQIALGLTNAPVTIQPAIIQKSYRWDVPLANCMRFGTKNEFKFEWQLTYQGVNLLEMRFWADSTRGFSGAGFEYNGKFQIITGDPVEQTACSRSLYDTFSSYNIDGSPRPNYPEVPAALTYNNGSYTAHYFMRNLSVTAARMLKSGGTLQTNLTFLWAYEQSSLYSRACYLSSVKPVTEMAKMQITFGGSTYSSAGGACNTYSGKTGTAFGQPKLGGTLTVGERHQNTRVAILFIGGDMLARSGQTPPTYNKVSGYVTAGENKAGVCQASLTSITAFWGGFSDRIGGITEYDVSVGTVARPTLFANQVNARTMTSYTFTGMNLPANSSIIVTVQAYNFAQLWTTVVSKPIQVLNGNLPVFGAIYDGTPSQVFYSAWKYQKDTTTLSATWKKWIAADHASRNYNTGAFTDLGYQYAVGLTGGTVNGILNWVTVGTFATNIRITGLSLLHGNKYSITIRATNCAGGTTQQTSPGVLIDTVPPTPGQVYFGNISFVHRSKVAKGTRVMASWRGFADTVSGIRNYMWAMSDLPHPPLIGGAGLIMGWQDVGLLTFARNGTIARMPQQYKLTKGSKIYIHVKAFDNAGNYVIANSNATTVMTY